MTAPIRVELVWHDAHSRNNGFTHRDDMEHGPYVVTSVGYWLQGHTPGEITLVQSIDADERCDNDISVPFAWVQRMTALVPGATLPMEPQP